jgi:octaprenyl-diphosphate synthase
LTAPAIQIRSERELPLREDGSDGLDRLTRLVADDLAEVNRAILARMQSSVPLIPQLASYIVAAGGKRLRPLLTLASARLCGHDGNRHVALATAVEFIHTATLLHDDVVDESERRRGRASANALFGNKPSVLVGDFLFSRAFQLMVEDGSLEVLRILSNASAVIAEGEVLQLATANDLGTDENSYLEVIRAKTAALFEAACEIGGVIAKRPADEVRALATYGSNLGIAFQIVDDVLDYSAAQARLGKSIGDDFRDGKVTLPVVLAYARSDEPTRAWWRRCLEDQEQSEGDLERAIEEIGRTHGFRDAIVRARTYGEQASAALCGFPASPVRDAMLEVVAFTIEREF